MTERVMTEYLGFRSGDVVLDLAELTHGTAVIKEFHLLPGDPFYGPSVVAVMENGSERYVPQLKKMRAGTATELPPQRDPGKVVPLRPRR